MFPFSYLEHTFLKKNQIIKEVKKCLTIESKCSKCKDIINAEQYGGGYNIIEELLKTTINEYNTIINKLI